MSKSVVASKSSVQKNKLAGPGSHATSTQRADRCCMCTRSFFWRNLIFLRWAATHVWLCMDCAPMFDFAEYDRFNPWLRTKTFDEVMDMRYTHRPWVYAAWIRARRSDMWDNVCKGDVDVTNYDYLTPRDGRKLPSVAKKQRKGPLSERDRRFCSFVDKWRYEWIEPPIKVKTETIKNET